MPPCPALGMDRFDPHEFRRFVGLTLDSIPLVLHGLGSSELVARSPDDIG